MEENHQDNVENKLKSTENKPWLLLSEPEDEKEAQKALAHLRKRLNKNEKVPFNITRNWTGFKEKTLWDWLNLLVTLLIPLVVVGATIGFGWWQAHLADLQHESDQQRALDQQQATILQTYIDNIQDLLLNHNLLGDSPKPKNDADKVAIQEVQELARARTLTALQGLDAERKGRLLIFLHEAQLIGFADNHGKTHAPIIDLSGADLSGADLTHISLSGADLTDVTLTYAFLDGANLDGANLANANLTNDTLMGANLTRANLNAANLTNADLTGATLAGTYLISATLQNATLSSATLQGAILSSATLKDAILEHANLFGAHVTQQQLDQVLSCLGAILPPALICHHQST